MNMTGRRIGKLVVQQAVTIPGTKAAYWNCLCDCGNTSIVEGTKLRRKKQPTRSCGCLRAKTIDRTNHRYGKLVAKELIGYSIDKQCGRKDAVWKCKCDCGNIVEVLGGNLSSKNSSSCGCVRKVSAELAGARKVYRSYRKHAAEQGRSFTLSFKSFYRIVKKPCHYCGSPPSNNAATKSRSQRFAYNGIDRYRQDGGYTRGNSLPCCRTCNFMKGPMDANGFINSVQAIYDHLDLDFFK